MSDLFHTVSVAISKKVGSPAAFCLALVIILAWALSGPVFDFSDTWQLIINTSTTIVTFLMVFLIQNTQNRDAKAMQIKLDELIKVSKAARDELIDLEDLTDEEIDHLQADFKKLQEMRQSRFTKIVHKKIQSEGVRRAKELLHLQPRSK